VENRGSWLVDRNLILSFNSSYAPVLDFDSRELRLTIRRPSLFCKYNCGTLHDASVPRCPMVSDENSLPADRVDFSSFVCFKRTVDKLISQRFYCVTVSDFDSI